MNPKETYINMKNWLTELAKDDGIKGAVIGISGGKDSAIAAAICANVLGPENVLGVMLPNGNQKDIADSEKVCEELGIKYETINIGLIYESLMAVFDTKCIDISKEAQINIAPRLRMTVLYSIAQSMGYRVCGTGNLSEAFVGYTTKWGDQACDFNPLGRLTSIEVVELGKWMATSTDIQYKPPISVVTKVPDDGLCGQTDEEKLGVTYQDIHDFITGDYLNVSYEALFRIKQLANRACHKKLRDIPMFDPQFRRFVQVYN